MLTLECSTPRGLHATSFPKVRFAQMFALAIAYHAKSLPFKPMVTGTPTKCDRNRGSRLCHQQGETLNRLAEVSDLS